MCIEHFTFILQMNNDDIDEEFEDLEAQDEEIQMCVYIYILIYILTVIKDNLNLFLKD